MQVNLFIPGVLSHFIYNKYIMELSFIEVSFFILALFTVVILVKYFLVQKNNKLLSERLTKATATSRHLTQKLSSTEKSPTNEGSFKNSIDSAELTTKLQKPRLKAVQATNFGFNSFPVPEKYSYIRSLTDKGLSPDEIASVLSLSPQEARQLVTLTTLGSQKTGI